MAGGEVAPGPSPIELPPSGGRTHDERVATFLQFACWDHHVHGKGDHRMHDRAAGRILAQHPEIAHDSIYTAVVCGDIEHVQRLISERPALAREPGGARNWPPLIYLCFTRFSHQPTIENAVEIARLLLEHGADPNAFYPAGDSSYTALVGVAGEGEQDSPRQPQADALFQLLLERGARPFDIQVLYNTHFSGEVLWWLELVYAHTMKTADRSMWDDPDWPMLDMGGYGSGASFLLGVAIEKGDQTLAEWLLSHGANPRMPVSHHPKFTPAHTLYEMAVAEHRQEIADLLAQYGATPSNPVFEGQLALLDACGRHDHAAAHAILARHPEYLQSTKAIFAAARRNRADVVAMLLELGVPIEVHDANNTRTLHHAAGTNARQVTEVLIARGAEIDPRETCYGATPIGWAAHSDHLEMIEYLSQFSRNVWTLAFRGYPARIREVLRIQPELARLVDKDGITPLWWLPDDEEKALEIVDILIAHGANPNATSTRGTTALDWALKRGMRDVAMKLVRHGG